MSRLSSFPRLLSSLLLASFVPVLRAADTATVQSPDGTISVLVHTAGALTYRVVVDGQAVLTESHLGLKLRSGARLGRDVALMHADHDNVSTVWENPLGKNRQVRDRHRELHLSFSEKSEFGQPFDVIVRVFDDGVGIRYVLPKTSSSKEVIIDEDLTEFCFAADHITFAGNNPLDNPDYPARHGFAGSQEWEYRRRTLSDLSGITVTGLPVLVHTPAAWVAIAEADLVDWSAMWVSRRADLPMPGVTLQARLAPALDGDGLVHAKLPHASPWRVLMIGRTPGRLAESDLIVNLATPSRLTDTSWIKPGLMAWDHWWSGDTKADTATIKQYIAFAGEMGWPYQLVDWHWYGEPAKPDADITKVDPAIDMPELLKFAQARGVRLWLWLHWTDADRHDAYQKAFALYEKWGIAGVKIDFMDRDDQEMVNWYEKITRAAAEHHLMVNFHGAFRPTGMIRTWPNQITREGVLGNEYNKWSTRVTPEHKATLPFTRFLVGPADFTPGGFVNRQPLHFQTHVSPTQVMGTRAAQLALFVVYDSPIGCVCDNPDNLRNQPGIDFLRVVPTVWDETRVLSGEVGEEIVMARRSGKKWFVGALTDSNARHLPLKLDFLGDASGKWKARWWRDTAASATDATQIEIIDQPVTSSDTLDLSLAPAGGAVLEIER
ncbi:MAG TPA: glycoside hydrolase family 97 protein [Candidatus Didemnitutus sp.]|nr:glycoside hydrolase family 97 protein [Candidatus Didemnitutus sp.]